MFVFSFLFRQGSSQDIVNDIALSDAQPLLPGLGLGRNLYFALWLNAALMVGPLEAMELGTRFGLFGVVKLIGFQRILQHHASWNDRIQDSGPDHRNYFISFCKILRRYRKTDSKFNELLKSG